MGVGAVIRGQFILCIEWLIDIELDAASARAATNL